MRNTAGFLFCCTFLWGAFALGSPTAIQAQQDAGSPRVVAGSDKEQVTRATQSLATALDTGDYDKVSKLMTESAFESLGASLIRQSVFLSNNGLAGKEVDELLMKYELHHDSVLLAAGNVGGPTLSRKEQDRKLLEFLETDQRVAFLNELGVAMRTSESSQSNLRFSGEIIDYDITESGITIKVQSSAKLPKPTVGKAEDTAGKLNSADSLMPKLIQSSSRTNAVEAEGESADIQPMNTPVKASDVCYRNGVIKLPPYFNRFVKSDRGWLYDGADTELEAKAVAAFDNGDVEMTMAVIMNPEFSGKTVSGQQIRLSDFRGKVVLIDFWGTWCKPCVAGLPKLRKLCEKFQSKGLEIVGVARDEKETLESFIENNPQPWESVVDNGDICDTFGIDRFPTMMLIDVDGNHVATSTQRQQFIDQFVKQLELNEDERSAVEKLLGSKPAKSTPDS